jgi:hypothetical protein
MVVRCISKNLAFGLYPSSNVFFPLKNNSTPLSPLFYLKTEAEPASETLFFKEKTLDDG